MICIAQWTFASETLAKDRKRLALRNPRVLCQKYGGACTTYQLVVPKVQETGREIGFRAAEKGTKELVSSDFAKILE